MSCDRGESADCIPFYLDIIILSLNEKIGKAYNNLVGFHLS